jgi:hypothetical protein
VRLRFEDILETLHRELSGRAVIAVTHGETMEVARLVLERLLPEQWTEQERGSDYKLANRQILHYSRKDPTTGVTSGRLGMPPGSPREGHFQRRVWSGVFGRHAACGPQTGELPAPRYGVVRRIAICFEAAPVPKWFIALMVK